MVTSNSVEWHGTSRRGIDSDHPPQDLHALYTWDTPPARIACGEEIRVAIQQQVISAETGGYGAAVRTSVTRVGVPTSILSVTYPDGSSTDKAGLGSGRDGGDVTIIHTIAFPESCRPSREERLYVGVTSGNVIGRGARQYTYAWQETAPERVTIQLQTDALGQLGTIIEQLRASGADSINITLEGEGTFTLDAPADVDALLNQLSIDAEVRWE